MCIAVNYGEEIERRIMKSIINQIFKEIYGYTEEAYSSKTFVIGSRNTYIGTAKNGIEVTMYIDGNGQIISAFPRC
jgi:hypothetical protein